jgi:transcriptional regulator with XRE-family HTH domain
MILGEKIRLARLSRNYTQENMATMLDISATAYRKIEKKEKMDNKRFNQVSNVLKMTEDEITSIDERIYLNSFNGSNNIVNSQIHDAKSLLAQLEKTRLESEKKDLVIENLKLQLTLAEERFKRNV